MGNGPVVTRGAGDTGLDIQSAYPEASHMEKELHYHVSFQMN